MKHYFKNLGEKRRFFITKEGLDSLRKRLDELTLKRLHSIQQLRLVDKKDTLDDPTVTDEIYNLEHSEQEISELNTILQKAEPVIKPANPTNVEIGYTVELDTGTEKALYTVVSPLEVDVEKGRISEDCLLGRALLGKQVGDTVSITTPKRQGNVLHHHFNYVTLGVLLLA